MNVKKAVKRLNRAEVLLTRVLDQFGKQHPQAQGFLKTAKESLNRAKAAIGAPVQSAAAKRVLTKADENHSQRQPKVARKRKTTSAKTLISKSKRPTSKNATHRAPTVHRAPAKKAEGRPVRVQPPAKKRAEGRKGPLALSKKPSPKTKPVGAKTTSA